MEQQQEQPPEAAEEEEEDETSLPPLLFPSEALTVEDAYGHGLPPEALQQASHGRGERRKGRRGRRLAMACVGSIRCSCLHAYIPCYTPPQKHTQVQALLQPEEEGGAPLVLPIMEGQRLVQALKQELAGRCVFFFVTPTFLPSSHATIQTTDFSPTSFPFPPLPPHRLVAEQHRQHEERGKQLALRHAAMEAAAWPNPLPPHVAAQVEAERAQVGEWVNE